MEGKDLEIPFQVLTVMTGGRGVESRGSRRPGQGGFGADPFRACGRGWRFRMYRASGFGLGVQGLGFN